MDIDKLISDLDRKMTSLIIVRDIQTAMNEGRVDDAIAMLQPWWKAVDAAEPDLPGVDDHPTEAGPTSAAGETTDRGELIEKLAAQRKVARASCVTSEEVQKSVVLLTKKKRRLSPSDPLPICADPDCQKIARRSEVTGRRLTTCSPECGARMKLRNIPSRRKG